jgi:hypothetical protein
MPLNESTLKRLYAKKELLNLRNALEIVTVLR